MIILLNKPFQKEYTVMISKTLADWILTFSKIEDKITITAIHNDGTLISDKGFDAGSGDKLAYRLTSSKINSDYREKGEADAKYIENKVSIGNWIIFIANDENNHLNIHLAHSASNAIAELSVNNGVKEDPKFVAIITDSAFVY